MTESMSLEEAEKRINEIAKLLANWTPASGSKGKMIIELRKLCGQYHTVPAAYKLEGVVKEGTCAQRVSRVTEIWKGRYQGEEVALKIIRVSKAQDDPEIQRSKSRFCKEVVLMKQVDHDNIIPFYGVSTTVPDFCLVFPWYENGDITSYLRENPSANRYDLLSGAVRGLIFLHTLRLVHGALRPSHILIDDDGNARLTTAGSSSIVAVPDSSIAGHNQSELNGSNDNHRYLAREIQWPELYGMDKVLITKESDVYGMAMAIYEVLAGIKPYCNWNDSSILPRVQAGETPQRPPGSIDDPVWELLQKCWSLDPAKRPPTVEVYNTLSNLNYRPRAMHINGLPVTVELPEKLKLQFLSIKFSPDQSKQQPFCVKLRYGNKDHSTSTTNSVGGSGEHSWTNPESWQIDTNKQYYGQSVSMDVRIRTGLLRKVKVCAKGEFSLSNNIGKETPVKLEAPGGGTGSAVVRVRLFKM